MLRHIFFKCRNNVFPWGQVGKVIISAYFNIFLFIEFAIGLCYLKQHQDDDLPPEQHYIQYAEEVPISTLTAQEEDEPDDMGESLRIIICMTKESSQRLLHTQYLQSDIAFKRVAGFLEFEIGGLNQNAKIGLSSLRLTAALINLNRQS
jgi:hypothetical protein